MADGFYIGPLKIYYYAIIIIFGILAAIWLSLKEIQRRNLDSEILWDMIPWLLVLGLIGARLWHVFTPSKSLGVGTDYYFSNPIQILNFRRGGLGIPGAVLGGALGLWIFSKKRKIKFLEWVDTLAPGLALAQAIGRWGNFINQELYGPPSTLPWAIYIAPEYRLAGYESFSSFHPMFLYESIWNLLNCLLLLHISHRYHQKLFHGGIFLIYLLVYPLGRFFLEFIRIDSSMVGGLNINQVIMGTIALISAFLLILNISRLKKTE